MRYSHWHEAGHAIAAEVLGIEVRSVTTGVEGGGSLNWGTFRESAFRDAHCGGEPLMVPLCIVYMAGWAGALIAGQDPESARYCAQGDVAAITSPPAPLAVNDQDVAGYRKRAMDLLGIYREPWSRLAHVMIAPGTYDGSVVRQVLAGEPVSTRLYVAALEARAVA